MNISCPHCQFSKEVSDDALPPLPSQVTCPQCSQQFILEEQAEEPKTFAAQSTEAIVAPKIHTNAPATAVVDPEPAGFWLRVLAATIDSLVCNTVIFVMSLSLGYLFKTSHYSFNEMAQLIVMAMGIIVTLFYYIFFTGYGGQTPGKMALQIKVIHNNGTQVSYGQAIMRETIGKMISYLLLGIGYLMVAFRRDKRAMHDLLASTRVIKL